MPGLGKIVLDGMKEALKGIAKTIVNSVGDELFEPLLHTVFRFLTSTPYPNNIYSFGAPTSEYWSQFYTEIYTSQIQLFVPPLFGLALGLAFFFNIFNLKQKKRTIRRAIFVYPFAYLWWWFGGWFLKFSNDLTQWLLADSSTQLTNNLGTLLTSLASLPFVGIAIYFLGVPIIFIVILIYMVREIAIYGYMVIMPVLLMLWVVPIDQVRGWAQSMMGKFVPLVFMTVPVALLLRVGTVLIDTGAQNADPKQAFMGIAMMGGAAVVPKYVFSFSSQVSSAVRTSTSAGRNIARGVRQPSQQPRGSGSGGGGGGGRGRGGAPGGRRQVGSFRQTDGQEGGGGGSGDTRYSSGTSQRDAMSHAGGVDFTPSMSRRRRRRQRAQKVGRGARKAASKTKEGTKKGVKGAGNRVTESAAKNYYANANTAKGMAKDALSSGAGTVVEAGKQPIIGGKHAVRGTSKRMDKINRRIKARQKELKQEYDPRANVDGQSQRTVHIGGDSGSETNDASEDDRYSDGLNADEISSPNRQTYDRNKSDRDVGSLSSSNRDQNGGEQ